MASIRWLIPPITTLSIPNRSRERRTVWTCARVAASVSVLAARLVPAAEPRERRADQRHPRPQVRPLRLQRRPLLILMIRSPRWPRWQQRRALAAVRAVHPMSYLPRRRVHSIVSIGALPW